MAKISYNNFRKKLREAVWPPIPGEARNLREIHNGFFQEAMATAGKWVSCLQVNNTTVFPFCSTCVQCAKSVIEAPVGKIKRVFTIANDEWCDPVKYWQWTFKEVECWAWNLASSFTTPTNAGLPALSQGLKIAEDTTDIEYGRARIGAWARHRHRLYLTPWIQSNESIVVEWDGVKQNWGDADIVDEDLWDLHVQEFIKLFVRFKHEDQFGVDRKKKIDLDAQYKEKLADIMHDCESRERAELEEECLNPARAASASELTDDEVEEEEAEEIVFANIGDFADPDNGTAESDVAALVAGWSPAFILSNGSNHFGSPADYATKVGAYYAAYIGTQVTDQKFFPAIGYHDWEDAGLSAYQSYFALPGNERFYDFVYEGIHFFVLHSGIPSGGDGSTSNETEGHTPTSNQAEWLRARLALSTATWKIVILHDPPYTSDATDYPGFTQLQWPFRTWGADVVFCARGHFYERQKVSGINYLINGAGGAALGSFTGAPDATSLLRYNAKNGAIKVTVTISSLVAQFINTDGDVIDTLTLTK